MTAIETRYYGPTNTLGSRVGALALTTKQRLKLKISPEWDERMSHRVAAQSLAYEHGWVGTWVQGGTDRGYIWVWVSRLNLESGLHYADSFYVAPIIENSSGVADPTRP